jgi:predicted Zn-dependent peptidase
VVEAEGEDAVFLAWRTVDANHADQSALVVMDWLVDNARSGLLNVELLLSQKLPAAGSYGQFYYEAGEWVLRGTAREGQSLEEVEALLTGVVDKLKAGEFAQEDIDAIVVNEEIREKQSLESTGARVFRMVSSFIHRTPWETEAGRLDRLRKVTREDVVRVANQYLGDDLVVVKRVKGIAKPPQIDKPKITPVKIDPSRSSRFAQEVRKMEAEPLEPEWLVEGEHYTRHTIPAGELVAVENARNDLFAVSYLFELGSRRQRLLCHALELLERSGAGDLSAEAVQRAMFAIGTSITTSCSADSARIDVRGIDRNLEDSLALLDSWLRSPRFTGETVSKLAENTLSQRKDRTQEPRFVASAVANFALYGNNSPNLLEPSNRDITRAAGPALARLLSALPDHQHRTTYFGPRSGAEVAAVVGLGRKHRRVKPRDPLRYRPVAAPQVFFAHQTTAQAQVRIAWRHPPLPNDRRLVSRLFTEYVGGGMGSLVFQEIREARGLAYSAWAYHSANPRPRDETALIAGMGTQADKTAEAMAAMFEILGGLTIDPQRFETARASLDQEFRASRVDPRWAAAWVLSWDDQGFRSDPRPDQWKALTETQGPSLEEFGRALVKGTPVVSVHGDRERIDLDALAERHGKLVEVQVSDLFSY